MKTFLTNSPKKEEQKMKVTKVKYGMTRITKQYEKDHIEVEVELGDGDTVENATKKAKALCLIGVGKITAKQAKEARALVAMLDGMDTSL